MVSLHAIMSGKNKEAKDVKDVPPATDAMDLDDSDPIVGEIDVYWHDRSIGDLLSLLQYPLRSVPALTQACSTSYHNTCRN